MRAISLLLLLNVLGCASNRPIFNVDTENCDKWFLQCVHEDGVTSCTYLARCLNDDEEFEMKQKTLKI